MPPSGKFARLALAVAFLLVGSLVLVVARAGAYATSQLVSNLLQTATVAWTAVCALGATRRSSGYLRQLGALFSASLMLVIGAQVLETYYESLAHTPFATPWPSDIVFILWVIPSLAMLLPRPEPNLARIPWEMILNFWETKREVIDRLGRSLAPNGYLFLGHAEGLPGMTDQLESVQTKVFRSPDGGVGRPALCILQRRDRAPHSPSE